MKTGIRDKKEIITHNSIKDCRCIARPHKKNSYTQSQQRNKLTSRKKNIKVTQNYRWSIRTYVSGEKSRTKLS